MAQAIIYRKDSKKIDGVLNNAKQDGDVIIGDNGSIKLGSAGRVIFIADNTVQIGRDEEDKEVYNPNVIDDKWIQIESDKTLVQRVKALEDLDIKTRLDKLEKPEEIKK